MAGRQVISKKFGYRLSEISVKWMKILTEHQQDSNDKLQEHTAICVSPLPEFDSAQSKATEWLQWSCTLVNVAAALAAMYDTHKFQKSDSSAGDHWAACFCKEKILLRNKCKWQTAMYLMLCICTSWRQLHHNFMKHDQKPRLRPTPVSVQHNILSVTQFHWCTCCRQTSVHYSHLIHLSRHCHRMLQWLVTLA